MAFTAPTSPSVLITGCSSGIGRELARFLARKGWRVWASGRRGAALLPLAEEARAQGWQLGTLELDVTDDRSVEVATRQVLDATGGRLDALVNNAGYFVLGALEDTAPAELARQFDTNVVGLHRVTHAMLPALRAARGVVVNLGSVSGTSFVPMVGAYNASKAAVHALSEVLRMEMAPFGVRVVLVEPGPFKTALHDKEQLVAAGLRPESRYRQLLANYRSRQGALPRAELEPLVELIHRAVTDPHPRFNWRLGPTSFVGTIGRKLSPNAVYLWLMGVVFGWRKLD